MDQLSQLTNRPLSSLSIPPSTLSALLRAGYETVQDLDTSNAEKLANGALCASSISAAAHVQPSRSFDSTAFLAGHILAEEDADSRGPTDAVSFCGGIVFGGFGASDCDEV
jgi:RAD51-like protein 2